MVNVIKKQKLYKVPVSVICYINKTKNNVFLTLTDLEGKVILQFSGGNIGMKGPKRDTPNTAELLGRKFGSEMLLLGYKRCILRVNGPFNNFVKSAVRGIQFYKIRIMEVQQIKCVSHNGIRKKKPRRM